MKPKFTDYLTVPQKFHRLFSAGKQQRLQSLNPGRYPRKLHPHTLVFVFLQAFFFLRAGLRCIVARHGHVLKTRNISTLSYALASPVAFRVARALLDELAPDPKRLKRTDILVLDSMAVTLPRTRRHHCAKFNDNTVGGGVSWALHLNASRSCSPLTILRTMAGAWNDSRAMCGVALQPGGPLHIMDRGFYAIDLIARWVEDGVRFIVRGRKSFLHYTVIKHIGRPGRMLRGRPLSRKKRKLEVVLDAIVELGAPSRRGKRPRVRLVILRIVGGKTGEDDLILASGELDMSTQELLNLYGRRWEIEEFHRLLKRMVGLAHVYSQRWRGIEFLIYVAALLAVLLWLREGGGKRDVKDDRTCVRVMLDELKNERERRGIGPPWRPNTVGKTTWRAA